MQSQTIVVEAILALRVFAMYNRNPALVFVIMCLFGAEVLAMTTVLALVIRQETFDDTCSITSAPGFFMIYWRRLCSLIIETVLFALTIVKFYNNDVSHQSLRRTFLFVILEMGLGLTLLYFVSAHHFALLANTLMYTLCKNALAGSFFFWEISIRSFAGSHVLLNLRKLAFERGLDDIGTRILDISRPSHTTTTTLASPTQFTSTE
ncbi:hypothetical protein CERSUDRAFT_96804 [Gelatoporia subvermispora B]|uniref:Uncharacterized protein n=1 Tax=Ceriporiopsis subvermispora (strain B) TaxID=914234 RepID=M2QUD7_CERS8|nr:hypothetical protein CERSUDRAFT_96804 [Gelatoporia subvermispora B]